MDYGFGEAFFGGITAKLENMQGVREHKQGKENFGERGRRRRFRGPKNEMENGKEGEATR